MKKIIFLSFFLCSFAFAASTPIDLSATMPANTIIAGPSTGADGIPVKRAMVAADVPTLPASKIGSGTIDPSLLGAGSSITTKFLRGDSTWQTVSGGSGVTSIATNSGLTGGTITSTGTIGIATGGITDTHVNASAGIAGTKVTSDFGEQTIYNSQTGDLDIEKIYYRATNTDTGHKAIDITLPASVDGATLSLYKNNDAVIALESNTGIITAKGGIFTPTTDGVALKVQGATGATGNTMEVRRSDGVLVGYFMDFIGDNHIGYNLNIDSGPLYLRNGDLQFNSTGNRISVYSGVVTAGFGAPAIFGSGRVVGSSTNETGVATYTVWPSGDGSFLVSANVKMSSYFNGSVQVHVNYTDEDNTATDLILNFNNASGTILNSLGANGVFAGIPIRIRAKASTAISVDAIVGSPGFIYNVEADITQVK